MKYSAIFLLLVFCGCSPTEEPGRSIDSVVSVDAGAPEFNASVDTLRILAYNIHHGEGMDEVLDLERIAQLILEVAPDLVALQEVDSVVTRTDGVDQATELGRMTGMQPLFGRFMEYQGGAYGMALLTRLPVRSTTNYRLPDGDEPRSALSAVVELPESGRLFRFIGIHLYRTEEERLAQAMMLEDLLDREEELPTILAGDFNSTPGSAVLNHLEESWHVVDKGEDRLTYSSFEPVREIDFFMWRPSGAFTVVSQQVLDEPVISDHRPLVIEVSVE